MTFAPGRLDRFARHIVLPELGGAAAGDEAPLVLVAKSNEGEGEAA